MPGTAVDVEREVCRLAQEGLYSDLQALLKAGGQGVEEARRGAGLRQVVQGAHSADHVTHVTYVNCLRLLVSHRFDVNSADPVDGRTALHWAVQLCDDTMTSSLMDSGADCTLSDVMGHTPLTLAIKLNVTSCLKAMLVKATPKQVNTPHRQGRCPLVYAARAGHCDACQLLLQHKADPNVPDLELGRTALHYSLHDGRLDIFTLLLRYGARADIRDKRGERVVHLACTGQSRDFMAAIVEISKHDDVINAQNEAGASPLMLACQDGDTDLVTLLLEAKTKVGVKDAAGRTALHYCTEHDNGVITSLLLDHQHDLIDVTDNEGYTALHLAVLARNTTMIHALLAEGASGHVTDGAGHTLVHLATASGLTSLVDTLLVHGVSVNTPDLDLATPLHYACQMSGSTEGDERDMGGAMVKKLLAVGAELNLIDNQGRTALHWAAAAGASGSCDLLVRAGAKLQAVDRDNLTPLHCACSRGHVTCVERLLKLGAACDVSDKHGCSPLYYCITLGHTHCVPLLLNNKTNNVNHKDTKGRTPAHCAACKGHVTVLEQLKKKKADLWSMSARGEFPVIEAAINGHTETVRYLMDSGGGAKRVNVANGEGRTCLHIAALTNNLPLCQLLVEHYRADVNVIMTSQGRTLTPYDAAVLKNSTQCAEYLLSRGATSAQPRPDGVTLSPDDVTQSQDDVTQPLADNITQSPEGVTQSPYDVTLSPDDATKSLENVDETASSTAAEQPTPSRVKPETVKKSDHVTTAVVDQTADKNRKVFSTDQSQIKKTSQTDQSQLRRASQTDQSQFRKTSQTDQSQTSEPSQTVNKATATGDKPLTAIAAAATSHEKANERNEQSKDTTESLERASKVSKDSPSKNQSNHSKGDSQSKTGSKHVADNVTVRQQQTSSNQPQSNQQPAPLQASPSSQISSSLSSQSENFKPANQQQEKSASANQNQDPPSIQVSLATQKKDLSRISIEQEKDSPPVQVSSTNQKQPSPAVQVSSTNQKQDSPPVQVSSTNQEQASPTVQVSSTNQKQDTIPAQASPTNQRQDSPPVHVSSTNQNQDSPPVHVSSTNQNQDSPSVQVLSTNSNQDSPPVHMSSTNQKQDSTQVHMSSTNQNQDSPSVQVLSTNSNQDSPPVHVSSTNQKQDSTPVHMSSINQNQDSSPIQVSSTNQNQDSSTGQVSSTHEKPETAVSEQESLPVKQRKPTATKSSHTPDDVRKTADVEKSSKQPTNQSNNQHLQSTTHNGSSLSHDQPNKQLAEPATNNVDNNKTVERTREEEIKLLTINSHSKEGNAHTLTVNSQSGNLEQMTSSDYNETKTSRNSRNSRSRKVNNETHNNNQTNTQSTGHVSTTAVSTRPSTSYPLANSRYGNRHVNKQQDSDQLTQSSGHVTIQSSNSYVTQERSQLTSQSRGRSARVAAISPRSPRSSRSPRPEHQSRDRDVKTGAATPAWNNRVNVSLDREAVIRRVYFATPVKPTLLPYIDVTLSRSSRTPQPSKSATSAGVSRLQSYKSQSNPDLDNIYEQRRQQQHTVYGSTRRLPASRAATANNARRGQATDQSGVEARRRRGEGAGPQGRRRLDSDIPELVRIYEAKRLAVQHMHKTRRSRLHHTYRQAGDERLLLRRLVRDYNERSLYDRHVDTEFDDVTHYTQALQDELRQAVADERLLRDRSVTAATSVKPEIT